MLAEAGFGFEQELVDRVASPWRSVQRVGELRAYPLQRAAHDRRVVVAGFLAPLAGQRQGAWIETFGQVERHLAQHHPQLRFVAERRCGLHTPTRQRRQWSRGTQRVIAYEL